LASASRLALEVVIEGSVADARRSLGLWLGLRVPRAVEESLRGMRRESVLDDAMSNLDMVCCWYVVVVMDTFGLAGDMG